MIDLKEGIYGWYCRQQARATLGFILANLPYTSPYTDALVCVLCRLPCIIHGLATYKHMTVYVYYRVMHFSAFTDLYL